MILERGGYFCVKEVTVNTSFKDDENFVDVINTEGECTAVENQSENMYIENNQNESVNRSENNYGKYINDSMYWENNFEHQ